MSEQNGAWFSRAERVIPGGVDSPVRSFARVGGTPYTVARGAGAYVTDVGGTRYCDYVQSYGASLLGHADRRVVAAVTEALARGSTFGAPTTGEVLLAEAIVARVEGCEQVRFVSSGTEAAMSAVRLARGATGRDRIIKFAGCYHGHADGLLAEAGSGLADQSLPESAGVTARAVADTTVVPYNVVPAVGSDVAAVIVEPVAANMGVVPPAPGFLAGLRAACDRAGALLIFDEVITGFRLGPGGASALTGVTPDLWCFGKVIGGGLPVGAFGGGRDLLAHLAPLGPVYQAGTLSGNPLAMAAGLAVLSAVGADDYAHLAHRVDGFAREVEEAVADAGLWAALPRVGTVCSLLVSDAPRERPTDFAGVRAIVAGDWYPKFFHGLLARGVALAPGPFESCFVSLAHTDADLAETVAAFGAVAAEVATR